MSYFNLISPCTSEFVKISLIFSRFVLVLKPLIPALYILKSEKLQFKNWFAKRYRFFHCASVKLQLEKIHLLNPHSWKPPLKIDFKKSQFSKIISVKLKLNWALWKEESIILVLLNQLDLSNLNSTHCKFLISESIMGRLLFHRINLCFPVCFG